MSMCSSRNVFTLGKVLARSIYSGTNRISSLSNFHSQIRLLSSNSFSDVTPTPVHGESKEPSIPAYQQREDEPIETLKARLLYQSRKRGMLENGLLLSSFAAKFLSSMSEVELKEYDRLINLPSNDWDIYYWATGVKPIPQEFDTDILHKFIAHVKNEDKESRIRQPDLYCK